MYLTNWKNFMCAAKSPQNGVRPHEYVSLRFRVQNRRTKWNFPLNFRTVAYPGLLLKGPSFSCYRMKFLNYLIMQLASTLYYHV